MVPAALAGAPALRDTQRGVVVVPELRRDFFELHNRLAADFPDAYIIIPALKINPFLNIILSRICDICYINMLPFNFSYYYTACFIFKLIILYKFL